MPTEPVYVVLADRDQIAAGETIALIVRSTPRSTWVVSLTAPDRAHVRTFVVAIVPLGEHIPPNRMESCRCTIPVLVTMPERTWVAARTSVSAMAPVASSECVGARDSAPVDVTVPVNSCVLALFCVRAPTGVIRLVRTWSADRVIFPVVDRDAARVCSSDRAHAPVDVTVPTSARLITRTVLTDGVIVPVTVSSATFWFDSTPAGVSVPAIVFVTISVISAVGVTDAVMVYLFAPEKDRLPDIAQKDGIVRAVNRLIAVVGAIVPPSDRRITR